MWVTFYEKNNPILPNVNARDSISAEDKLTLELLDELIENYQVVFHSIIKYKENFNLRGV